MNSRNLNLGKDNSMDLKLNENKLRIQGSLNILSPLEIDKSYDFTCSNLEITGSQDRTNNDGTINRTFIGRISEFSDFNFISDKEVIQTKKKKGSQSQVLKMKIEERWEQMGSEMEKEAFYVREMSRIISNY